MKVQPRPTTPPADETRGHSKRNDDVMARTLGRFVALAILLFGALAVAVGMTACDFDDDDPNEPDADWYLSGVWANQTYPDEDMYFFEDGTGYWQSNSTGSYLDFDYYCYGDNIFFTFYPAGAPQYSLNCYIYMRDGGHMSITWPPSSMYGSVTIWYYRVD